MLGVRLTQAGPCFDSEPLNDMWEAPSCPLPRKHTIGCPYLIHDELHLLAFRKKGSTHNRQGKGSNRTKRETSFIRPILWICKIQRSIIFYSHVDSNYRLFPMVEWMRNFFHLLESWQFDNHRATAAVWAAKDLNLNLFFSPPDSQESLFSQLFSSVFLVLTHFLFLDRFYFPAQYRASQMHHICLSPDLFLELKTKGKILSHVSFRISRWPPQWSTQDNNA